MSKEPAANANPHLTAEFFVWLWYAADREGGTFDLGDPIGLVDMWVENRLSFRIPDEDKARAVLTGDDTAASPEARAALASGKVVRDLQLHLRREEREYSVTLRGANLDLAGLKLPPHATDGEAELLYERMFLYEDAWEVIGALYRMFARERTSDYWYQSLVPAIRAWAAGAPAGPSVRPKKEDEE